MYNKFLQWLLPSLIGKRTVVCNAHIRSGAVMNEPIEGVVPGL